MTISRFCERWHVLVGRFRTFHVDSSVRSQRSEPAPKNSTSVSKANDLLTANHRTLTVSTCGTSNEICGD